jgi:hypothetical protein
MSTDTFILIIIIVFSAMFAVRSLHKNIFIRAILTIIFTLPLLFGFFYLVIFVKWLGY